MTCKSIFKTRPVALSAALSVALAACSTITLADERDDDRWYGSAGWQHAQGWQQDSQRYFRSIATFDVMAGNGSEVAEIVDVSEDGRQLVYTDGGKGEIGFVNIRKARKPVGDGVVAVGGEPTSLVVRGDHVLVGVNTSASFIEPSGKLVVVDRKSRAIVAEYELGGQPDSVALSPNGRYAAIVIENERDEDLNDGLLPQFPTGGLLIVQLKGAINT
jgi:hypothetical protein